ncbi:MAG: FGGY family carbohydrate kinase [Candidatus Bathyarchaeia archaeon]
MDNKKYVLVNDVGTTMLKAVVLDEFTNIVSEASEEISQIYPKPGWCEQDPNEIWNKSLDASRKALQKVGVENIAAMGLVTQRGTTVLWDQKTGKPIYNAITWQDVRSAGFCQKINSKVTIKLFHGLGKTTEKICRLIKPLRKRSGVKTLIQLSHFDFSPIQAGARINWLINNVQEAKEILQKGDLLFGTVDTWLLWKYTQGQVYATDYSNASSTGIFDPFALGWSKFIMNSFDVPKELKLPEIKQTSDAFGQTTAFGAPINITSVVADQQAALFGEACFSFGDIKCTNGTGTFIDINTGDTPIASGHGLTPLIAWKLNDKVTYMLEGFVQTTGSLVQWLKDIELIKSPEESEVLAKSVEDTAGVYCVPALTGLGAPYWDPNARGTVIGLTRKARKEHIVRAALESIGYSCNDIIEVMKKDTGSAISSIKIDGGASKNDFIAQFLADITNMKIERPKALEMTAIGAGCLAGLAVGYWKSTEDLLKNRKTDKVFVPKMEKATREALCSQWKRAIERSYNWATDESVVEP